MVSDTNYPRLVFSMIIHCTRKLAARLPDVSPTPLEENSILGGWHAHLLHFDRRQCVFFCHDVSRAVLFAPGLRKPELQQLGSTLFPQLLLDVLQAMGCEAGLLARVRLAIGPVRFDTATDRSVQGSMNIARQDLEAEIYRATNVLDLDPVAVSCHISHRPARVRGKFIWPEQALLESVRALK